MESKKKKSLFIKGQTPWNKGKKGKRIKRVCEICEKEFEVKPSYKKVRSARFCSDDCRNRYFARMPRRIKCIMCDKDVKDRMGGDRKYCSQDCYWEDMRGKSKSGKNKYITIKVEGRRIREHRYVMEKHLGRKLTKKEIIHHKDGNRANNNIKNLELMTQSEHMKKHIKY